MNKIQVLLAQTVFPIENKAIPGFANKEPKDLLGKFLSGLIGAMLVIATLLALVQLFQGGFEWISSGGDKTGLENARTRIINALVGLIIVFVVWVIYIMVLQFLGIIGTGGGIKMQIPTLL